jgi:glycine/D-amino acid oxidase-like deaminating enzyme
MLSLKVELAASPPMIASLRAVMSLDGSPVMTTVGVIGAGHVGASCARAIVRDGLVTRLTIYDRT